MIYITQALDTDPGNARAKYMRSLIYLMQGDFKNGWDGYESRHSCTDVIPRPYSLPLWDGCPIVESSILVFAEQGVGDEVMFASCLNDLISRSKHVIIDCDPRLAPLFRRSFPTADVHGLHKETPATWLNKHSPIDYQIPIGSLPRYLRPDEASFSHQTPYLLCDPIYCSMWAERLATIGDAIKIGISWKGGRFMETQIQRSIDLLDLYSLSDIPGIEFINLQYFLDYDKIKNLNETHRIHIHEWPGINNYMDLDLLAAKISQLDLVITVDNFTAHLAGALGIPTWVLLPCAAEWRWMPGREDSYWYPSVNLLRQPEPGDWRSVLEMCTKKLQEMVGPSNRT